MSAANVALTTCPRSFAQLCVISQEWGLSAGDVSMANNILIGPFCWFLLMSPFPLTYHCQYDNRYLSELSLCLDNHIHIYYVYNCIQIIFL